MRKNRSFAFGRQNKGGSITVLVLCQIKLRLFFVSRKMNSKIYTDILEMHLLACKWHLRSDAFFLQHDNASCHASKATKTKFNDNSIPLIDNFTTMITCYEYYRKYIEWNGWQYLLHANDKQYLCITYLTEKTSMKLYSHNVSQNLLKTFRSELLQNRGDLLKLYHWEHISLYVSCRSSKTGKKCFNDSERFNYWLIILPQWLLDMNITKNA